MSQRLTIGEVSERSGVSISTLDHWRIDGMGPPAQRIDGRISYDQESFEAWLAVYSANSGKDRQRPGARRR
jgi:DNA-binding transcriptional MerR regulator